MSTRFGAVEPLEPHHNVDHFECGREQLDRWLRASAGQGQRRDTARTFVVCRPGETGVVGYYTLVASQVEQSSATSEVQSETSKHFPIPVCLIARLAVDRSEQSVGLGRSLLLDALQRIEPASRSVAMRAVLIHALDEEAAAFYARFGFKPATTEPLTLMVPLEVVRHTLDKLEAYSPRMESAEWKRWWEADGRGELRTLLMTHWDPIGVNGIPQAHDEYDSYLDALANLLGNGADADGVAGYLADIEKGQMELSTSRDQLLDVANRTVDWYAAEMQRWKAADLRPGPGRGT